MSKLEGRFQVTAWDEHAYREEGSRKLTLAVVSQTFSGGVSGSGEARWLMAYQPDGTAHFVGLQQIDAEVEGRRGSFVLETIGDFNGTTAVWAGRVVEGSATAGLEGLRGEGSFAAPHGSEATFELELSLT